MVRAINYLCYACTLISIPLTIYLYFRSVEERAPTYYVSRERTRIVDTSVPAPSQLQVLYKGRDLNANVNAVTVYLWNDGKLPIKSEDVLDPVRLQLEPGSEILDARLLKVSRVVTRFARGEVSEAAKNVLPLSFGILERGDGATLQIIYAGKPDATVSVTGAIVGASQLRSLTNVQHSQKERHSELLFLITAWGTALLPMFALAALVWKSRRSGRPLTVDKYGFPILVAAMFITISIIATYQYHEKFTPVVP